MYFSDFVKNNPIEVFIFKDDTERTLSFVESFQKFSKNLNDIYRFYMDKHFNNIEVKNIIYKAYETGNDQITSIIEDPNFILQNYLKNINPKINILNLNISNPCSIDGNPGNGSFYDLATESEDFNIVSKFQNLEEFVLLYDWPGDYYSEFDFDNSLSNTLNSIKSLKRVIFKENDYLLKALSSIKVENALFINNYTGESEISTRYQNKILETEMLNNIKNVKIKIKNKCQYENKILKYNLHEYEIQNFINCYTDVIPGLKNIEQFFVTINCNKISDNKDDRLEDFTDLIKSLCTKNKNLQKLCFNYINHGLSKIIKVLYEYCNLNNSLKHIELTGKTETNNINTILDYIAKIKIKKVYIIVNLLDDNIKKLIINNENIINRKLVLESLKAQLISYKSEIFEVNLLKIK